MIAKFSLEDIGLSLFNGYIVNRVCCTMLVYNFCFFNRTWTEGKFIIFDDSFEHEVWHDGDSVRLVLIVDMWHPDLTAREKATLPAI